MAYLDPKDATEHLQSSILEGIQEHFPIKGKLQTLYLDRLEAGPSRHPDDLRGQHEAKVTGGTWSTPLYGHMVLKDNATGKVVDQRRVRLAEIPQQTSRYSYILDGQEYQMDNQWQLKPGIYTRRGADGVLQSHFNATGKGARAFDVVLDPATQVFTMQYGSSKANIPLYPLLKTMGVEDSALTKAWGKDVLEANKKARNAAAGLEAFHKAAKRTAAPSKEVAATVFHDAMTAAQLRPDATEVTVGRPFTHVTGDALRLATEKLLKVQAGHPEDDRDSLVFKDLRTTGDYVADMLRNASRSAPAKGAQKARSGIQARAERKINTTSDIRDLISFDSFNVPIKKAFHENSAARVATQINPVEMVAAALQTTVMGSGGIKTDRAVSDEAKFVNPSHLGFLDPINTPEGTKTGVTLRLPMGVKKEGKEAKIKLYNLKTHEYEMVAPAQFVKSNVVLPDQVHWENGKPAPLSDKIKMSTANNEIREGTMKDAHYVLPHAWQLFNMTSNLVPFLNNTSGGRASMASRQMEQAISLVHREAPLVQVGTGMKSIATFENLVGLRASHQAPVTGKVTEVKKDGIVITGADGKPHEVQLYHNYPLNDAKGVYHSTPLVKVGDKVAKDQVIADTNFSKNGTLALGTNLRTAYIPFKGYNFEDGIVISESAAKKLSSAHLQKNALPLDKDVVLSKRKFQIEHPGVFKKEQLEKLDDTGIVHVGQKVQPGDPLIAAMKPYNIKDRTGLAAIRRSLSGAHTDKSLRWDSEFEGEVVGVHRNDDGIAVHVRTVEPMQVGDKMAGRYGNKGIVTMILPDKEMPHTKSGEHVEVALNPSGVPGRMNVGQLLETAAGKIVQKTGKSYVVQNFGPQADALARVQADLKKHGLTDTEELFDPVTKQSLGKVMYGPQHQIKLVHQVEKKLSVRSGMSSPTGMQETYDMNLQPTSGSSTGGQSLGALGMYALLAHGAKANIREMQSYKAEGSDPQTNPSKRWASDHDRIWAAIQTGGPLPTPKPTFAFHRFTELLKGAGVNMEKKGHQFILSPLTDTHIKELAKKELPNPADLLLSKLDKNGQPQPKPGGLFDEHLTGGHGGRQWTRIGLAEPLPNPLFEGPIKSLTGLNRNEYAAVIRGEKGVTTTGKLTDAKAGVTGGHAIKLLLDRIDVKKELPKAEAALTSAKAADVDKALKKVKYLRALDELKMAPSEAYVLHNLPVLPPVMRPVSVMPDGNNKFADVNQLYSDFAKINDKLKDPVLSKHLTDERKQSLREDYYDGVKALMGVGVPYADAKHKGILHEIAGSSPKYGYFQSRLINRRQDLSMRSTIVPEPALGLDEVGIPRQAALDLFKPFVVRKLKESGAVANELQAPALIAKPTPAVWHALDKVMEERPVLLKRDPALHKYSVQAFKARPVEGNAIKIHPLVTGGYNADFDGDTMAAFVPITRDAVMEAHRMFPSNNLFSEATGKVMFQPTLESALGLYKLSLVGKETNKKFQHPGEAIDSVRKGQTHVTDVVHLNGQKTTAGRVLLASAVPEAMQKQMLHDLDYRINKGGLDTVLTQIAKNHAPQYGDVVNRLKDLGNGAAFGVVTLPKPTVTAHNFDLTKTLDKTPVAVEGKQIYVPVGAHTLSLADFKPDTTLRQNVLSAAHKVVKQIQSAPNVSKGEKDRQAVVVYEQAEKEMKTLHEKKLKNSPTNLFTMYEAGVKPGWDQYKQMVLAPMIYKDSADRKIPTPVTKSYSEGLDVGGYWTQMHGARRGSVMKVQEVSEPGYMSKLLMNNMMHILVDQHDCGTTKGVSLDIHEKDVHDRHLQQDFTHGNLHVPAGTLLTPDVVGKIRAAKRDAKVVVRSPLKCESEKGICQKCAGLDSGGQHFSMGTNIGVQAAHAVGERAIQLTLKSFHTGGVGEQQGSKILNSFGRFEQLMTMPDHIPDEASLAKTSGKVESIHPTTTGVEITINGKKHHVGRDTNGMALHKPLPNAAAISGYTAWTPPQVGQHMDAGAHLSDPNRTIINPHRLYEATGSFEKVQNHLANEVYGLYEKEGIKRRAVETVIKAMSNLTEVVDPGDHAHVLRGEYRPLSSINHMNQELAKQKLTPIEHRPVLKGIKVMPLELQEDWMAKLQHEHLRGTLMDAAATRGVSHIHGPHPIPAIAFGAEIGLTKKDAIKPGYGHLANVQEHHY